MEADLNKIEMKYLSPSVNFPSVGIALIVSNIKFIQATIYFLFVYRLCVKNQPPPPKKNKK